MASLLKSRLVRVVLVLLCLFACPLPELWSYTTRQITNSDGAVVFELQFWGTSDGAYISGTPASGGFTNAEMNCVAEAAQYWVDILKPTGQMPVKLDADGNPVLDANGNEVHQPVVVRVGYDGSMSGNAWATSAGEVLASPTVDKYNVARPQGLIADGTYVSTASENGADNWVDDEDGCHAVICVGSGWTAQAGNQSQSGRTQNDLGPVIIHELGHALGISSSATYAPADGEAGEYGQIIWKWADNEKLNRWDSHLRDNNGNPAKPGKVIDNDDTEGNTQADKIFDMGDPTSDYFTNPSKPTFVGRNSLELWYGKSFDKLTDVEKNTGVPIQGYVYGYDWNYPYNVQWYYNPSGTLSHIDTTNSLMSWQDYRNYPGFIEIELAVMEDIGYDIDRRNFFGKSFYVNGDGTKYYNSQIFGAWDPVAGTYSTSKANTSTYAIGAHLFASNLDIVQTGSIYANGDGSAGIRIDGQNNTLTVAQGTKIITDGLNGIGVLAAYGKDHSIIHRGYIHATGDGGIGVSFDFGEPVVGDKRGSYYYGYVVEESPTGVLYQDLGFLPELEGALVKNFDVTGTIIGSKSKETVTYTNTGTIPEYDTDDDSTDYDNDDTGGLSNYSWVTSRAFHLGAAIKIDETAHVENINIMNGAQINGDILSFWRGKPFQSFYSDDWMVDELGNPTSTGQLVYGRFAGMDLPTTISFGLKSDANGVATTQVDKDFKFTFKDNINYFRYELNPNIKIDLGNGNYTTVSPAPSGALGDDTFWHFIAWRDGFMDYQFAGGDISVTIVRPGDGKVYADVVTPGMSSTDLHFVGGITEFQGSTVYVRNLTVDAGATLTLTADESDPSKTPDINISAQFDPIVLPDFDATKWEYTVFPHPDPPTMYNYGRISGDGIFKLGQRRYTWDGNIMNEYGLIGVEHFYWDGTFDNQGTLAPGANDGEGVGTIEIVGDLQFGKNSAYEMTISRIKQTDKYGQAIWVSDGETYYILDNGTVVDKDHNPVKIKDKDGNIVTKKMSPVYIEGNDLIKVSGETTLGGTLKIKVAPDSTFANATSTYTIIESGSFTAGTNFSNYENSIGFLQFGKAYVNPANAHQLQITINRDMNYFERRGRTFNELSIARAIDHSVAQSPEIAFSLGDKRNSDADIRDVLRQMDGSIRANGVMMNLWNPAEMVFNHIGWGNGQMETGDRGRINWDRMMGRKQRMLGQNPVSRRSGSFWGDVLNTSFDAETDGNCEGYKFNRTGFMVGGEWNLTPYSSVGAIAAYAKGDLRQRGDKVESDDYNLGLYFVFAPFNEFEIKSYIGLGFQEYDMNRHIRNANIYVDETTRGINDRYKSSTKGNSLNASIELARPLMLHPTFILRPTLGFDAQHVWQNGFTENQFSYLPASFGSNLYALKYKRMHYDRILFRAGFSSETGGYRGGLRMRAFYVTNIGGENYPSSTSVFAGGGEEFLIRGVDVGRNYLNLGIGTNLWLDGEKTSSLFFDYDSNIYTSSQKVYVHTINVGFVQNF